MTEPLIRLEHVEKSFPQGTQRSWVLRNIGMEIPAGDFVSITGPSGSGKSTLLAILGLMDGNHEVQYRPVSTSERRARVADLLDRFQMVGKKDLYPNQLSGGQQQQVAVARALISRPALLLADEPTGALHSTQAAQIMSLLRELNDEGMTIIQVTHNPECAAVARRQLSLFDGWLSEGDKA